MDEIRKKVFSGLKKLVVKVGTKILTNDDNSVSRAQLSHLVAELGGLQDDGLQVVLVTSGAVGVGMGALGLKARPKLLPEKQACAAIGQFRLMHLYSELFAAQGRLAAQILLSGEDFRDKRRYDNIRNTVQTLLSKGVTPIINENDTITTEEIKVGDNDKLSADVAHFLEADLLVILSDEDGLYTKNPKLHADAEHLAVVPRITKEVIEMGGGPGSAVSVGGMRAKLLALRQATEGGTPAVLTHGRKARLRELVRGEPVGTLFLPNPEKIGRDRRWLAFVSKAKGQLLLDEGGVRAMRTRKSSVLAAGIRKVRGSFKPGDFVEVCDLDGYVIGRGRVSYSSQDVMKIRGERSGRIPELLKRPGPQEVIHRDHLVIY